MNVRILASTSVSFGPNNDANAKLSTSLDETDYSVCRRESLILFEWLNTLWVDKYILPPLIPIDSKVHVAAFRVVSCFARLISSALSCLFIISFIINPQVQNVRACTAR